MGVHEELRAMKDLQSKGIDTSGAVMNALKTARSTGDLRAAIRRGEDTKLPELDLQIHRGQLDQMEREEKKKTEEEDSRRAVEKRQAAEQTAKLMQDLERARQETSLVTQVMSKCKDDLRKEEIAKKQIVQERDAVEGERKKMKVRHSSLTQIADQKQMELVELKKQIAQLRDERLHSDN